jgi:hypothetical protein
MRALIDADVLVYRVGFSSEGLDLPLAKWRLDEMVMSILEETEADNYFGWLTGKGNFRYDIAKTVPYKGNRTAPKPEHYTALREHLVVRYGFMVTEGIEADDAVCIAAHAIPEGERIIVKVDKDLNQIPGKHYNPIKKEFTEITEFEALLSFYTQILTGDRVDNIEGLKGIGPVKAKRMLEKCTNEHELYQAVLDAYDGNHERVLENGRLLWLQRKHDQLWIPPLSTSSGLMPSPMEAGKP